VKYLIYIFCLLTQFSFSSLQTRNQINEEFGRIRLIASKDSTEKLIEMLYSDFSWDAPCKGHYSPPPSYKAGGLLTRLFPECGISGADLLPQFNGISLLRDWFSLNKEYMTLTDDGGHTWSIDPKPINKSDLKKVE